MSSPIASPARNESFQIERRGDLAVITPSPEVENMAENLIEQAAQMVLAPLKANPPGGLIVGEFTAATSRGVLAWQKDNHLEQTGAVDAKQVVFLPWVSTAAHSERT